MQGGAVYQTIDALCDLAEQIGLKVDDDTRKNALGYAMQNYLHSRISQGNIDEHDFRPHIDDMQQRAGMPSMLMANPLASSIQQGLGANDA